jgi:hypothetical protein
MAAAAEQGQHPAEVQAALYTEETLRFCQGLPKVELHAHLNGSIRDATIRCCACRLRGWPACGQRLAAQFCICSRPDSSAEKQATLRLLFRNAGNCLPSWTAPPSACLTFNA